MYFNSFFICNIANTIIFVKGLINVNDLCFVVVNFNMKIHSAAVE